MKIGFFGGCFNPPTIAHIELAKKTIKECNLDKVIFVPVGDFYIKKELVPAIHRYNMLKIACEKIKNVEVSDLELDIKENIHAIEAFKLIKNNYPSDDIYFIMGADNFINIMNWKGGKELIENYKYIVLNRNSIDIEEYINSHVSEYKEKILLIQNEEYKNFSSSTFRKNKYVNREIIPKKVVIYIEKNNIF